MNPRRGLALLAAVTAAVIIVVRLTGPGPSTPPAPAVTSAATPAPGVPAADAATAATPGNTPTSGPAGAADDVDDDSVQEVDETPTAGTTEPAAAAARFARAWTRHTGADAAGWADRLAALCTPTLAGKLRAVDPDVVPADTVTGAPRVTITAGGADAAVATDAGTLQLTLIHHGRWQVDTLDWTPTP